MAKFLGSKAFSAFLILAFIAGLCLFYYTYVPLAKAFQIALVPILILTFVVTVLNREWGLLLFVFSFPLVNSLPYFFKIYLDIPHAPTALVLFLFFFLGWRVHDLLNEKEVSLSRPIFKPLGFFSLLLLVSLVITFLRYANFYPFCSDHIHELTVNANGVRAGGALMSNIFSFLSYVTGFGLFYLIAFKKRDQEFIKKILFAFSLAAPIFLSFALVQKFHSISLGNTPFWVSLGQINSTFKDPNSFAAILTALIPVLLGMAFFYQGTLRWYFSGLMVFAFIVFPLTGSRSGFLGLGASIFSFLALFLISSKMKLKKKLIVASTILILLVLLSGVIVLSYEDSVSVRRLDWSFDVLGAETSWNRLFLGRLELWKMALMMFKHYPISGVGVGAYIVELPNYTTLFRLRLPITDSAQNHFIQIAAELGLAGLIFAFWLIFIISKQITRNWKAGHHKCTPRNTFILIGMISGIIGVFIHLLFHTFIASYEVQYFLWLLVGLSIIGQDSEGKQKKKTDAPKVPRPGLKKAALILVIVFGASHLWNSAHSLSINRRTERFGWSQNFGFYQEEKDERGHVFRWTKKTCGLTVENLGSKLIFPIIASHPEIEDQPAKVEIYSADQYFKRRKLLNEITLRSNRWTEVELSTPGLPGRKFQLVFETNRAWSPLKHGIPDPRRLAVGLAQEWFKYPAELSSQNIESVEKISSKNWEKPDGMADSALISNGSRRIRFMARKDGVGIRLSVKGQKFLDVGPYLIIRLDDRVIGKTQVTGEDWMPLVFTEKMRAGEHELSVEFINDLYDPEKRLDRNAFLGDLEIVYFRKISSEKDEIDPPL